MKSKPTPNEPELTRQIQIDKISAGGIEEVIEADEKERVSLAQRFGLLEIKRLSATLTVEHAKNTMLFSVKGQMTADVIQQCVASLEPLQAKIVQGIDVLYVTSDLVSENEPHQPHFDPEEEDTETILNGIIDLGELVAQNLGVALDPYPRKPGEAYIEVEYGTTPVKENPFAKLKDLAAKKHPHKT